ncbi:MAG: SpoIIE family protein phosphatase [bacterium]|nr:SpoIIE family protein phosphatase [bacterium]
MTERRNYSRFLVLTVSLFFTTFFLPAQSRGPVTNPGIYTYQLGDDPSWAQPDFDDSGWKTGEFGKFTHDLRETIGWARFVLHVEGHHLNKPLGITFKLAGAAEIYLDGQLIRRLGKVGHSKTEETPYLGSGFYVYPIYFHGPSALKDSTGRQSRHVLAIRYSGFFLESRIWTGFRPYFSFSIGDIEVMNRERGEYVRRYSINQMLMMGIFLALALLHLLIYLFYPKPRANLYFSFFAASSAAAVFFLYQTEGVTNPDHMITFRLIFATSLVFLTLTLLRFAYSLLYLRPPKIFYWFASIGLALFTWNLLRPFIVGNYIILFCVASCPETLRAVLYRSGKIRNQEGLLSGSWIVGLGAIPLMFTGFYEILRRLDIISDILGLDGIPAPFYAVVVLMIFMSVFLARQFATTNKDLETKLVEVRELSQKRLEEEDKRIRLETENARKTQELEEARKLQLSMLPETVPQLPYLEIAVYMQTATEVGGDYYDFHLEENNGDSRDSNDTPLTLAIGDATGHGLQAGTMVAAAKSLFNAFALEPDPVQFLAKSSEALKKMGFRKMFMAMTIAKFDGYRLRLAAAGMPFALILHAASNSVEEVKLKGTPLGSTNYFPYQEAEYTLDKNDMVLFMSDGLAESFNPPGEMFGFRQVKEVFLQTAGQSPQAVIDHLKQCGEEWAAGTELHDDVTLMAIKMK